MKRSLENIYKELEKLKKPMIERKSKPISPEEYDNILKAVIANKLTSVKDCGCLTMRKSALYKSRLSLVLISS